MPRANINTGMKVCCRKNCQHGGKPQPITAFYPDKRAPDGLKYECSDCSDITSNPARTKAIGKARNKRAAAKIKEDRKHRDTNLALARSNLIAGALQKPRGVSHMSALAEAVVRQAGSHERIMEDYLRLLEDPMMKPQHKVKLYDGIVNILAECDKQNPGRGDPSMMTDGELEDEIRRVVMEMAAESNRDAIDVEFVECAASDSNSASG